MKRPASVHEFAEAELNEAVTYYETQRPGLGADFLEEYRRALAIVVDHPQSSPPLLGDIRWAPMTR